MALMNIMEKIALAVSCMAFLTAFILEITVYKHGWPFGPRFFQDKADKFMSDAYKKRYKSIKT